MRLSLFPDLQTIMKQESELQITKQSETRVKTPINFAMSTLQDFGRSSYPKTARDTIKTEKSTISGRQNSSKKQAFGIKSLIVKYPYKDNPPPPPPEYYPQHIKQKYEQYFQKKQREQLQASKQAQKTPEKISTFKRKHIKGLVSRFDSFNLMAGSQASRGSYFNNNKYSSISQTFDRSRLRECFQSNSCHSVYNNDLTATDFNKNIEEIKSQTPAVAPAAASASQSNYRLSNNTKSQQKQNSDIHYPSTIVKKKIRPRVEILRIKKLKRKWAKGRQKKKQQDSLDNSLSDVSSTSRTISSIDREIQLLKQIKPREQPDNFRMQIRAQRIQSWNKISQQRIRNAELKRRALLKQKVSLLRQKQFVKSIQFKNKKREFSSLQTKLKLFQKVWKSIYLAKIYLDYVNKVMKKKRTQKIQETMMTISARRIVRIWKK